MKKYNLGELADIITGPFGSQLHASDYVETGIPSIMPKDIGDRIVIHDTIAHITEKDANRLSKYRVEVGDIVYSRRGDIERCALIGETDNGALCGTGCLRVRPNKQLVNPIFLSFYLSTPTVRRWVVSNATGATMPNLNSEILKRLPLTIPSLEIQDKIATNLKILDDKITLNKEIISTLESLSKTLYDYYFLQFDFPDEKGRPYKSSGGKMEYNAELGREIPAGWKVTCLKKYIDIGNGKDHSHLPNGDYPVYGSGGLMRRVNQFLYDKESVLIPRKGTLNNVMLVNGPFWTVDTMYYTILKNPNSINYVYQTVKLFNLEKLNTGSALPSMTANIIYNLKVPDAPLELINEYERATKKLLSKLRTTENENRHLTALRDFLLPLLMNGQVGFKK